MTDIPKILKRLGLNKSGKYENHFYIISLDNSDDYAKAYSLLDNVLINTEYPSIQTNTVNTPTTITNYFEITKDDTTYNIFLIANFVDDIYKIKIGEKPNGI